MANAAKKQDVAVKDTNTAVSTDVNASWGTEGLGKQDLLIPKILMAQGMSEKVKQKKLAEGDLYDSVSGDKLGDEKTPVEVIPISSFKTWTVLNKKRGKNKPDFVKIVPVDATNQELPREQEESDGSITINNYTLNFNVLLVKEIQEGGALPHVVSFQRTSLKTGKALANQVAKLGMMKQPAAAQTAQLGAQMVTNDQGTFLVFTVSKGRNSTKDEITEAKQWYDILSKGAHRIDDSDLQTGEAEVEAEDTTQPKF